jgi:ATP-dependent Clp protease ATP-binding subunit ClpA
MFERFTESAREVVVRAQEESRALGHNHIGTEHLLLGAAAAPGDAARVLADNGATADALRATVRTELGSTIDGEALAAIGIDLDEIRRRVEAAFGPGALERRRPAREGHIPFTPRAKKSLELALREAIAHGDKHIGTEHILLGVLRDDKALATCVLRQVGADPRRVREALTPAGGRRGRGA